jgi:hypothetical protein
MIDWPRASNHLPEILDAKTDVAIRLKVRPEKIFE